MEVYYVPVSFPSTLCVSFLRIIIRAPWDGDSELPADAATKVQRGGAARQRFTKMVLLRLAQGQAEPSREAPLNPCRSQEQAKESHCWGPFL